MPRVRSTTSFLLRITALAAVMLMVYRGAAYGQLPVNASQPPPKVEKALGRSIYLTGEEPIVQEVRVVGNRTKSTQKVLNEIGTKPNRPLENEQLQRDVRKLAGKTWFLDVKPEIEKLPGNAVIVTFKVVERPVLEYVKYVGNGTITTKTLGKQTDLKAGMALDPYAVEEGRRKIEQYYQEKGFNDATVTVIEGTKTKDRGAIYLINEGKQQKVWYVQFEGNTIASDSRLKTQIQTKRPVLYLFKGQVERKKIDEDVDRLTAYYRSLGYFRARVGRELEWNEKQNWLTLTFVIDEGPRYKVRNISFMGHEKFTDEQLSSNLKLKGGQFFDQPKMNADLGSVRDIYGSVGYVFADVQADTRFLEEPGQVDLVYNVAEGKRYRVGKILVKIDGDHPHTRQQAVLNRISLRPGDIVDIRQLRASERRLRASGLFMNNAAEGVQPKLVIVPPDLDGDKETGIAEKPERRGGKVRGQSPDDGYRWTPICGLGPNSPERQWIAPGDVMIDVGIDGIPIESPETDEFKPFVLRNPLQLPSGEKQQEAQAPQSQSQPKTIIRSQSPDAYGPDAYGRGGEVIRGQYSGGFGGRQIGGMGPPPAAAPGGYAAAPQAPYNSVPSPSDRVLPPPQAQPGYAPATPAQPGVQPFPQYGNPGPPQQPPPPVGGPFANGQPQPMDENGFVPNALDDPDGYVDIDSVVQETQTGRFMFGVGVNSDAGLIGSIVVDEQNFDWRRWPKSFEDFRNGTAFRGAGQRFRLEAAPGTQVQRYMVNFSEPFLFDTPVSLGLSGFYYTRGYTSWTEERLGAKVNLGYQFTPDLSGTVGFGGQNVNISNPQQPTPPALAEVLGNTQLYTLSTQIAHDTRDNTFLPTEGHLISLGFDQNFGDFVFPRFTADLRRHFTMRERPDGSGRHVLSLVGRYGISGSDTPIYERFFIGGFSTLRGFQFRGASPQEMKVIVGGDMQILGTAEYMLPITADDMLRGVVFCDAGTDEPTAHINWDDFRVAPGVGLRVTVPALGPAPIALDFAFPVAFAPNDHRQVFSFFVGFGR